MITYNQQTRQFERDGVPVTSDELRELIDRLTLQTKREARRLSGRLERGEISRDQWAVAMLALLRAAHVVAASVGSGGIGQVTEGRWQKVERKVKWQAGYLVKFGVAIAAGAIIGSVASRAAKYASAIFITFSNAFQESQTAGKESGIKVMLVQTSAEGCDECNADAGVWTDPDELKEIGDRICGDFCRCFLEFSGIE